MDIVFATSNPHKLSEARPILAAHGVSVRSLDECGVPPAEPVEDQATFEGNAALKARYYAAALGLPCLAEDSGLEVDALHGAPGVRSARYAGVGTTRAERDAANNERLLEAMSQVAAEQRQARFVCALCLALPNGELVAQTRGTFEGVIGRNARGTGGFGYDCLMYLPAEGKTSAELTADEKNARSHRGSALRRLVELLPDIAR